MNTHDTPYDEQPLYDDFVRLLTIEKDEEGLRLNTAVYNLDNAPTFTAISYVWGDAPPDEAVKCNRRDPRITQSVSDMLPYLDTNRQYWIDAVCINQTDNNEKAVQIPLMQRIYSEAKSVTVWIGIPSPNLVAFFENLHTNLEIGRRWTKCQEEGEDPSRRPDCALPLYYDPFWKDCYELLHAEWFSRLWTFQEAVFAKIVDFRTGTLVLDADQVIDFVCGGRDARWFQYSQEDVGYIGGTSSQAESNLNTFKVIEVMHEQLMVDPQMRFPNLLNVVHMRVATEPVDRIWAVAPLLGGKYQGELAAIVDYSEKGRKEYWRTYLAAFSVLVNATQRLDMLSVPQS